MGMVGGFDLRSAGVPREAKYDRPITPILILIMLLQALRNRIIYILIVLKLGREDRGSLAFSTKQFLILAVEKVASTTHGTETEEPEDWVATATAAAAPAGLGGG